MIGSLLIHGFTGSPEEVEPLYRELEQRGFHVIAPVLKGHGGKRKELKLATWKDWVKSAEAGLQELMKMYKRVIVIGFSMGGMIAAHLAARYPIERLILLSPAMFAPNYQQIIQDLRESIRNKEGILNGRILDYAQKMVNTPIKTVWQYRLLVKHLSKDLPHVNVPTLIIHGNRDDIVHPRSAKHIYDSISSHEKRLYYLPRSKHIICHDTEAEYVKNLVTSFLPQF